MFFQKSATGSTGQFSVRCERFLFIPWRMWGRLVKKCKYFQDLVHGSKFGQKVWIFRTSQNFSWTCQNVIADFWSKLKQFLDVHFSSWLIFFIDTLLDLVITLRTCKEMVLLSSKHFYSAYVLILRASISSHVTNFFVIFPSRHGVVKRSASISSDLERLACASRAPIFLSIYWRVIWGVQPELFFQKKLSTCWREGDELVDF